MSTSTTTVALSPLPQAVTRFLLHLALYPVVLLVALALVAVTTFPDGVWAPIHPFMDAGGKFDLDFAPRYIREQFAYYALIPCWGAIGILTGILFRARHAAPVVRSACLTLFSLWIFGLCLVNPRLPFVGHWAEWEPATAGLICAAAVCCWHRSRSREA